MGSRISNREPVPASAAAVDARPESAFRSSKVPAPATGGWREREIAKAAAAAAAASGETDASASAEKNGDTTVEKNENAPPAADTPSAPGKYVPRARREALGERSNSGDLPPPSTTRPPREERTRDTDLERPAKEDGESAPAAPALRGVTAGKWGERNTERRERDSREPRDRDTRETTTGASLAANGDEKKQERPTAGRWQPSTRREGREGETMPERKDAAPAAATEGGDAAPKGAYRPGAYRARGGGMGQRSGSGRDAGKEQKEGESTSSGGRWQR